MNINQLVEHIKADNLAEAIAFQISGTGYVQVRTRDSEKFETVLTATGDRPLLFSHKKEALAYVDNLVKQAISEFNALQQDSISVPASNPAGEQLVYVGINTQRKVYQKTDSPSDAEIRVELSTKTVDKS